MPVENNEGSRFLTGTITVLPADATTTIYRSDKFYSDKDFEFEAFLTSSATVSGLNWTLQRVLMPGDISDASTEWRDYKAYAGHQYVQIGMKSSLGAHYRIHVLKSTLVSGGLNATTGTFGLDFKFVR